MARIVTRREVIKSGALAFGAAALAPRALLSTASAQPPARSNRVLRVAHLTDLHIQPERAACAGVEACLAHMMAQPDRPQVVLTGGDLIMDGFEADRSRTRLQWDLWRRHFSDGCALPVHHCLGNHDIWGWNKAKSGSRGDEAEWGKRWAMDELGMAAGHHAQDHGPWRLIALDTVQPDGDDGYRALLDEPQFHWLRSQLADAAASGKHVLIVTHIPIFSVSALDWSKPQPDMRSISVPGGLMHMDAARLMDLFREHRCVRACLSGHMHRIERIDYDGVGFICDGAVSGSWWKGPEKQCDEGYGLIDLHADGSFDWNYHRYGWVAKG